MIATGRLLPPRKKRKEKSELPQRKAIKNFLPIRKNNVTNHHIFIPLGSIHRSISFSAGRVLGLYSYLVHLLVCFVPLLCHNKVIIIITVFVHRWLLSSCLGEVNLLPTGTAAADDVGGVDSSELVIFLLYVLVSLTDGN